jgi:hypothetical protein
LPRAGEGVERNDLGGNEEVAEGAHVLPNLLESLLEASARWNTTIARRGQEHAAETDGAHKKSNRLNIIVFKLD